MRFSRPVPFWSRLNPDGDSMQFGTKPCFKPIFQDGIGTHVNTLPIISIPIGGITRTLKHQIHFQQGNTRVWVYCHLCKEHWNQSWYHWNVLTLLFLIFSMLCFYIFNTNIHYGKKIFHIIIEFFTKQFKYFQYWNMVLKN